ncbi:GMC family oxidoreductase [Thiorhodococcus fuscus]|uniref:GMC family oxidoreductase n=1 Tax=Thiorhodococcus fuscus TaxID=527200 RepID=A0ABW4Y9S7_9GAMM
MAEKSFDYIVVGAGSAGATIAANLIERRKGTVLLLEAGANDRDPLIHIPAAVGHAIPRHTWPYAAEPAEETNGRVLPVLQGRVLGGSSSVNGMLYVRGQREDYDRWETEFGCTGWNADEMLRYFKKSENNESLSGEFHGNEGHLRVSENRYRHPLTQACIRAGQQLGYQYITDYNNWRQEGCGFFQAATINGRRCSTSVAYLSGVRKNPNLSIVTDALVERIEIENQRATGVTWRRSNARHTATARAEVIVCAGAIGSPKLLQLSGVGPVDALEAVGIQPKLVLPVGENFHDHMHMSVNATTRHPISLYGQDRGLKALRNLTQWLLFRTGILTSTILEGFLFADTCNQGRPDVELHFLPVIDAFDDPVGATAGRTHGLTIKTGHLQPRSRGRVILRSNDPSALPRIEAGYLSDPEDLAGQVRATRLALRVLEQPTLRAMIDEVFNPACSIDDDAALEEWVRNSSKTVFHPVGTCRMGTDPKTSVTDLQLRVHGIANLRVADSSSMPQVPSGNTNAPVIALAEKAADLICEAV